MQQLLGVHATTTTQTQFCIRQSMFSTLEVLCQTSVGIHIWPVPCMLLKFQQVLSRLASEQHHLLSIQNRGYRMLIISFYSACSHMLKTIWPFNLTIIWQHCIKNEGENKVEITKSDRICECKSCLKIHRATRFFTAWITLVFAKISYQLLKVSHIIWRRISTSDNLLIILNTLSI